MHSIKTLREKALITLRSMSRQLISLAEDGSGVEGRRVFMEECKPIRQIKEIDHDYVLDVAKKVTDARKKVREGLGKGLEKICKAQGQGLNLTTITPHN